MLVSEHAGHGLLTVVGGCDRLDDELLAGAWLHTHAHRLEAQLAGARQESRVDERGLAVARVAIQEHAAVDVHEALQLPCLVLAREEDRSVRVAKRLDPAIRGRRDGDDGFVSDGYGASSSPRTSSYSAGTKDQTSCAMNFT